MTIQIGKKYWDLETCRKVGNLFIIYYSNFLFFSELDDYFEDPANELFADDSDQDDVEMDPGLNPRGVQALFVDTSSPRYFIKGY